MIIYFGIQLLYVFSSIYCHTTAFFDKPVERNKTLYKIVVFNNEKQNNVCIITEMNVILVIKNNIQNFTSEITIGDNSTLRGNCSSFNRQLSINFGEIEVDFTWIRDPDPYEFGEIGWSSVGAPANTTSGTYTLSIITLSLPLSILTRNLVDDHKRVTLNNLDHERFKTRSGDFYACETRIGFDLSPINSSKIYNSNLIHLRFDFENMKMQAFSDVNVSDFTGTGQLCHNDLPADSGVSIGIGVAVSVLVVAVLAFLAIGRLKEKDQQYEEIEPSKFVPQKI